QRMGARVVAQYAVLGPYDFVTIIEAPDNATISRVSVELGARGGVAGMTMAAIPLDEFIGRLERGVHRRGERKRPGGASGVTPKNARGACAVSWRAPTCRRASTSPRSRSFASLRSRVTPRTRRTPARSARKAGA